MPYRFICYHFLSLLFYSHLPLSFSLFLYLPLGRYIFLSSHPFLTFLSPASPFTLSLSLSLTIIHFFTPVSLYLNIFSHSLNLSLVLSHSKGQMDPLKALSIFMVPIFLGNFTKRLHLALAPSGKSFLLLL